MGTYLIPVLHIIIYYKQIPNPMVMATLRDQIMIYSMFWMLFISEQGGSKPTSMRAGLNKIIVYKHSDLTLFLFYWPQESRTRVIENHCTINQRKRILCSLV